MEQDKAARSTLLRPLPLMLHFLLRRCQVCHLFCHAGKLAWAGWLPPTTCIRRKSAQKVRAVAEGCVSSARCVVLLASNAKCHHPCARRSFGGLHNIKMLYKYVIHRVGKAVQRRGILSVRVVMAVATRCLLNKVLRGFPVATPYQAVSQPLARDFLPTKAAATLSKLSFHCEHSSRPSAASQPLRTCVPRRFGAGYYAPIAWRRWWRGGLPAPSRRAPF